LWFQSHHFGDVNIYNATENILNNSIGEALKEYQQSEKLANVRNDQTYNKNL